MTDLFLIAARRKFRFPSSKGELTTEQLFDLPLTSARGASLDAVARGINAELREESEGSFVTAAPNPRRTELALLLDIVKAVIEIKQSENALATARAERADKRRRILDAIAAAESRDLASASKDELLRQLAELDD